MLPSSAAYKSALHFPHKRHTVVDVLDADGNVTGRITDRNDPNLIDGSVSASLTQRVTRSAELEVPYEFFPWTDADLLAPEHAFLRITSGIEYADGSTELFPIFYGRVTTPSLDSDGRTVIRAEDRAAEAIAFRFEQPRNANLSQPIVFQIRQLIAEAVPGATFGTDDVEDAPTPQLTWDEDRGKALDDLSESLGARWYALGDGSFVVRRYPYDNGTVAQEYADGVDGLLSEADVTRTRIGTANSVTVVSERTDGTDPVRITVRDTDPASPTFFGDRFGRVTQVIKIQTPLTSNEAQRFATAQLNAAKALTSQWFVSGVPDHTLEPGDAVRIRFRGHTAVQVIDTLDYPLGLGPMTFTTREFSTLPTTLVT